MKIEGVKITGVRLVVGRSLRSDAPSSLLRLLRLPFLQIEDGPGNARPGKWSGRVRGKVVEVRPSTGGSAWREQEGNG